MKENRTKFKISQALAVLRGSKSRKIHVIAVLDKYVHAEYSRNMMSHV
jgi:hypothetical protein